MSNQIIKEAQVGVSKINLVVNLYGVCKFNYTIPKIPNS